MRIVADWADVDAIASGLPETERGSLYGEPSWRVRGKAFAWERPLRKAELAELGEAAPTGDVLAALVADLGAKEALLADDPDVYFTTGHFADYAAVLVRLEHIRLPELRELLVEAWFARAPKRLADQHRHTIG